MTDIFPEGQWPAGVQRVATSVSGAIEATLANQSLYDLLDAPPAETA